MSGKASKGKQPSNQQQVKKNKSSQANSAKATKAKEQKAAGQGKKSPKVKKRGKKKKRQNRSRSSSPVQGQNPNNKGQKNKQHDSNQGADSEIRYMLVKKDNKPKKTQNQSQGKAQGKKQKKKKSNAQPSTSKAAEKTEMPQQLPVHSSKIHGHNTKTQDLTTENEGPAINVNDFLDELKKGNKTNKSKTQNQVQDQTKKIKNKSNGPPATGKAAEKPQQQMPGHRDRNNRDVWDWESETNRPGPSWSHSYRQNPGQNSDWGMMNGRWHQGLWDSPFYNRQAPGQYGYGPSNAWNMPPRNWNVPPPNWNKPPPNWSQNRNQQNHQSKLYDNPFHHGYKRDHEERNSPGPRPFKRFKTGPPRKALPDQEALDERVKDLKRAQENVQKELEEHKKKSAISSKVEQLRKKLSKSNRKVDLTDDSDEREETEKTNKESEHEAINQDLILSNDDYKEIGSGKVLGTNEDPNLGLEFPDLVSAYAKSTDQTPASHSNVVRVANEPAWKNVSWWQEKKRKADEEKQLEENEDCDPNSSFDKPENEAQTPVKTTLTDSEREKYSAMAENIRTSIISRDRNELKELVDCPTNMKRLLMTKLFDDHRKKVSEKLNQLRFQGATYTEGTSSISDVIRELEDTESSLKEVDMGNLPDDFITQIEDFIKREKNLDDDEVNNEPVGEKVVEPNNEQQTRQEYEDEEIMEVPVPPKPTPPLVDIEEEDDQQLQRNERNEEIQIDDYHDVVNESSNDTTEQRDASPHSLKGQLRLILEEERSLLEENNTLLAQIRSNNQRLECLQELRMNLLG